MGVGSAEGANRTAVLLLAHGTPEEASQIPDYLARITGGRRLSPEFIAEIERRYRLIGRSPLTDLTMAQARALAAALAEAGQSVPVYVGMRNWEPSIAATVVRMRADGIERAAVLCLAPHNAEASIGLYRRAVDEVAQGLRYDFTSFWGEHPELIAAFAERLAVAHAALVAETGAPVPVLFTAHSLPVGTACSGRPSGSGTAVESPAERGGTACGTRPADDTAATGNPALSGERSEQKKPAHGMDPAAMAADAAGYEAQCKRTAELVAGAVGLASFRFAFQSQSTNTPHLRWLGPTVEETLEQLAAAGERTVLVQPIGFLADHVEILYDIDLHFREVARGLGVRLERTGSLNDSPALMRALADLARKGLARLKAE